DRVSFLRLSRALLLRILSRPHFWSVLRTHTYSSPFFFFQAEDGIRDFHVTGVQTCALPISPLAKVLLNGAMVYADAVDMDMYARSEERRVGKSVDLGGRRIIKKKT